MKNKTHRLVFDAQSKRWKDSQGFLHIDGCHITKAGVRPYLGSELPRANDLGLDPSRVYNVLCPMEALDRAVENRSFEGLHLLFRHVEDTADNPQKELRVGNVGTSSVVNGEYLDNDIVVTDIEAIAAVESGAMVELSSSYGFDPVLKGGVYKGEPYDIEMTNLRGNHVALVEEGRAGSDVRVADEKPQRSDKMDKQKILSLLAHIAELLKGAEDVVDPAEKKANDADPAAMPEKKDDKPVGDACGDPEKKVGDADPLATGGAPVDKDKVTAAENVVNVKIEKEGNGDNNQDHPGAPDGQVVMDAALISRLQNDAVTAARKAFQAQGVAARECRTVLGDVDPLVFDSADAIYGKALAQLGYDPKTYPAAAWRGMVQVATNAKRDAGSPVNVSDSALPGASVEVKGVDNIRIG